MKQSKRKYHFYLDDILLSMTRIEEYIDDLEFVEFKQNWLVVDAVVRNFEIIGEASKNIPIGIQGKYPEVPWKKMVGLRNLISHEYFGVDYEMIWEIAKRSLPENINDIKKIIEFERK